MLWLFSFTVVIQISEFRVKFHKTSKLCFRNISFLFCHSGAPKTPPWWMKPSLLMASSIDYGLLPKCLTVFWVHNRRPLPFNGLGSQTHFCFEIYYNRFSEVMILNAVWLSWVLKNQSSAEHLVKDNSFRIMFFSPNGNFIWANCINS